jgi:hypothetical protein
MSSKQRKIDGERLHRSMERLSASIERAGVVTATGSEPPSPTQDGTVCWQIPPTQLMLLVPPLPQQSPVVVHFSPTWEQAPPVLSTHIGPWPTSRQNPEQHSKPAVQLEAPPSAVAVGLHGEWAQ